MLSRLFRRLDYFLHRDRYEAYLREEMEYHRERTGGPAFGNVLLAREDARDVWAFSAVERVCRDVVYAVRGLRREPTFALTALLTLTLGAVTTITIFTIVDAELWKPLPFPNSTQLVAADSERPGSHSEPISGPDLMDWNAQSSLVEYVGAQSRERRVLRAETAESVTVLPVTTRFLSVFGVSPALGRTFGPDDRHGAAVMLSGAGWQRLFNGDPLIVGRSIVLDDQAFTVVGVTGMRIEFESEPDFFVAIDTSQPAFVDRRNRMLEVYGRMHPGVHLPQARSELQGIFARIASAYPADHANHLIQLFDLQEYKTGFNWRELYFFLAAAALVMVLSCLNVANLLFSRALRRQREFAIRGALGGGRGALVRQLLVEGAVLAIPGATAAVVVSAWGVRWFVSAMPPDLLLRKGFIAPDLRAIVFALGLSVVTTIALALSPLFFARRLDLNVMLGQSARIAGRSRRQRTLRDILLIAQVTLTLVLLTGAGLFTVSFLRLTRTPVGFDPGNRISLQITLSGTRYREDPGIAGFANRLMDEAAGTSGVRDVAIGSGVPFDPGAFAVMFAVPGRPRPALGSEPLTLFFSVTPAYFRALGIPLTAGRAFTIADAVGAPRVAVVNERLARRMFPDESALGKTLEVIPRPSPAWTQRPGLVTIVGIAADIKNFSKSEVEFNNLYVPFAQAPSPELQLIASTLIPASDVATPLRHAAALVDPSVPIRSVSTLPGRIRSSLDGARFNLTLITVFAALALVVAAVGIYGSVACAIEERSREFGVRIALGAAPRAIFGEALRESVRVAAAGSLLGAGAVVALARILGNALYLVPGQHGGLLYQVGVTHPAPIAAACALLVVVAAFAGLSPALKATRVDPLVVLRTE